MKILSFFIILFISLPVLGQKWTFYTNTNSPNFPFTNSVQALKIEKKGVVWASDRNLNLGRLENGVFTPIPGQYPGINQTTGRIDRIFKTTDSAMLFTTFFSDTVDNKGGLLKFKNQTWTRHVDVTPKNEPRPFIGPNYDKYNNRLGFPDDNSLPNGTNSIVFFESSINKFSFLTIDNSNVDTSFFIPFNYFPINKFYFAYNSQGKTGLRITNRANFFKKIRLLDNQNRKKRAINSFNIDSTKIVLLAADSVNINLRSTFLCDTSGCVDITDLSPNVQGETVTQGNSDLFGNFYLFSNVGLLIYRKKGNRRFIPWIDVLPGIRISNIDADSFNTKWFSFGPNLGMLTDVKSSFEFNLKVGCKNTNLTFYSTTTTIGDGIRTYIWQIANDSPQTYAALEGDTVRFTFPNPGNFRVKLIAIDSNGVADSSFQQVSILNSPGIQLNIEDSIVSCKTTINLTAFNGTKPTWYLPDSSTIFNTQSILTTGAGIYIVRDTLTIDSISCYSSDSVRLIKQPPTLGSLELSNSTNGISITTDTIYSNDIKSILISGTPQGSTFSMIVNGNNLKKNPAIVSTDSLNKLEIFYTVKDQDSCQFFVSKTVYIKTKIVVPEPPKPEFIPNLPSLITANNDAYNQSFTDKTGSFPIGYTLEIFNRWGQSVFKKDNYQNEWPVAATKEGLYFYLLTSPTGIKYTGWVDMMR